MNYTIYSGVLLPRKYSAQHITQVSAPKSIGGTPIPLFSVPTSHVILKGMYRQPRGLPVTTS